MEGFGFTYQMKCEHTQVAPLPQIGNYMTCNTCRRRMQVIAIECREFKFKCNVHRCTVARWTGQSSDIAFKAIDTHRINTTHNNATVDYTRHPEAVRRVEMQFGGRLKTVIVLVSHKIPAAPPIPQMALPVIHEEDDTKGIPF
jgi:hypothetical protein